MQKEKGRKVLIVAMQFLLVIFLSTMASALIVDLQNNETENLGDATIISGEGNYGNLTYIEVGDGGTIRSYLIFNISLLYSNGTPTILNATLSLFNGTDSNTEGDLVYIYAVNESWDESTINYSNQPNLYEDHYQDEKNITGYSGWSSWNVTNWLINMTEKNQKNASFVMMSNCGLSGVFWSKEYSNSSVRPKLTIAYTDGSGGGGGGTTTISLDNSSIILDGNAWGDDAFGMVMGWNITSIPDDVVITDATLGLWVVENYKQETFNLTRLLNWTWNRNTFPALLDSIATANKTTISKAGMTAGTWTIWNITELVNTDYLIGKDMSSFSMIGKGNSVVNGWLNLSNASILYVGNNAYDNFTFFENAYNSNKSGKTPYLNITYASSSSDPSCGALINGTVTLTSNKLITSETCYHIRDSNTVFNCDNFNISSGSSNAKTFIQLSPYSNTSLRNIIIRNCNFYNYGNQTIVFNTSGISEDSSNLNKYINNVTFFNNSFYNSTMNLGCVAVGCWGICPETLCGTSRTGCANITIYNNIFNSSNPCDYSSYPFCTEASAFSMNITKTTGANIKQGANIFGNYYAEYTSITDVNGDDIADASYLVCTFDNGAGGTTLYDDGALFDDFRTNFTVQILSNEINLTSNFTILNNRTADLIGYIWYVNGVASFQGLYYINLSDLTVGDNITLSMQINNTHAGINSSDWKNTTNYEYNTVFPNLTAYSVSSYTTTLGTPVIFSATINKVFASVQTFVLEINYSATCYEYTNKSMVFDAEYDWDYSFYPPCVGTYTFTKAYLKDGNNRQYIENLSLVITASESGGTPTGGGGGSIIISQEGQFSVKSLSGSAENKNYLIKGVSSCFDLFTTNLAEKDQSFTMTCESSDGICQYTKISGEEFNLKPREQAKSSICVNIPKSITLEKKQVKENLIVKNQEGIQITFPSTLILSAGVNNQIAILVNYGRNFLGRTESLFQWLAWFFSGLISLLITIALLQWVFKLVLWIFGKKGSYDGIRAVLTIIAFIIHIQIFGRLT